MRIVRTALFIVAVCCWPGAASGQSAPEQTRLSDDWKQVRGPSLEVVGNASSSELRRAATSLEQFRHALRLVFPGIRTEGSNPTRVIVFRDQIAMNPFKPRIGGRIRDTVAGYFMPLPDVNYLVLAPVKGSFTYQLLFHEYTHHIVRLNAPHAPLWLNEGLAEVYSTFMGADRDSRILVGRPPPTHGETLDRETLIPLRTLLSPESARERLRTSARMQMFYAQSWALVHYLLLGEQGRHQQGLRTFLATQHGGLPLAEQFQKAFGMHLEEMEGALRTYVHRRQLPAWQVPPPEHLPLTDSEPLRETDALQIQGDLLVRLGQRQDAERYLQKAAGIDPSHLATQISLARSRLQDNRLDEALTLVETAVAAAPDNFSAQKLHGSVLQVLGRHVEAIAAFGRALKLRPGDVGSFYGASIAQVAIGQPQAAETFAAVLTLDPDPSWYATRLIDTWELGKTEGAIEDGKRYLQQKGWTSETSVYVAMAVALEHMRRGEAAAAADLLSEAAEQVETKSWPAQVVGFLQGRVSASKLLERADSDGLMTEARAYIGMKALFEGRTAEGVEHLQWVVKNGSRHYTEYQMALGELKRLNKSSTSAGSAP